MKVDVCVRHSFGFRSLIHASAALLGLILLLPTAAVGAQEWFPPDSVVQATLREMVDNHQVRGVVVGMLDSNGARRIIAGGYSGNENLPLDGETVFEIGSITKVFTGTLLAEMVRVGEVQLAEPVAKLLPPRVKVPARNGKQITLLDLSTHHSGLPPMPENFQPRNPENPYSDYTVDQIYQHLSGYQLSRDPGKTFDYSNFGTGLLGLALSLHAGKSYEALIAERVLRPLRMTRTVITLTPDGVRKLARGHKTFGDTASNWDIPALGGAGALRSTMNDMLTFASANLTAVSSTASTGLIASLREAQRPRRFIASESGIVGKDSVGLNWIINASPSSRRFVWHNGGTGGYSAVIVLDPASQRAVIVLANSGDAHRSIQPLAFHLLDPKVPLAKPRLGPLVAAAYRTGGIQAAMERYRSARLTANFFEFDEADLNRVGYWLLREQRQVDDAVAIFRLNVDAYNESPNTHDSLGEALVAAGRLKEARDAYGHAVALAEKQKSSDLAYYQKNLADVIRQLGTSR